MESIAKFGVNLARSVPVKTAEGLAVVELDAAVGDVESVERSRETLAEILAKRKIERGVLRQMVTRIRLVYECITEAGTVIDVGGRIGPPRKGDVAAEVERVALVVIECEERSRRRKIRQATSDGQFAFCYLIGIRKVDLSAMSDARRAQGQFPATDSCSIDRDR